MNLNRESNTLYTCCSVRFLHIICPAAVLQTFEGFAADICRWDRPAFVQQQIKYLKMLLKKSQLPLVLMQFQLFGSNTAQRLRRMLILYDQLGLKLSFY